ncbi:cytochrome [Bordetella genomosp. 5]|uniref:cytochrome c n=1 Tax=Bordetella genomosp. 5 TaxID=1395608 RepID=UPI000B9DD762|nr:cytochrome c [Bordetella genomosp. 5]OZI42464.1 cytochrome [Bordetella genomosp. 5]
MSLRLTSTTDLAPPDGPALAHGVLLLPPHPTWDARRYTGPRAGDPDASALRGLPGMPRLIQHHNLVAVIATRPNHARAAAARLAVPWRTPGAAPQRARAEDDVREGPAPLAEAHYRWPLAGADHAACWAIACPGPEGLTVWSSCPADRLRTELTALLDLPATRLRLLPNGVRQDPGANDSVALDAAAVAALLSLHAQQPVRVDGADLWLPHASAVGVSARLERGAGDAPGPLILHTDGAATPRPSLARLLAHDIAGAPPGDAPPYRGGGVAPLTGPVSLGSLADARGALRAAQVFAQESLQDEAADASRADPVAWRLAQLDDPRGAALIRSVAERAGWQGGQPRAWAAGPRQGRGFAYASVIDDSTEPPTRNWAAWVADVTVDPSDGAVALTRVVVGHDTDTLHVPAVAADRITTDIHDQTQRLLRAPAGFDQPEGASPLASVDPKAHALAAPRIDLVGGAGTLAPPRDLQWSDAAALPAAAAVANAVYAATGVRLREPPFNGPAARAQLAAPHASRSARRATTAWLGGIAAAACGLVAMAWPWKAAIAPVDAPDLSLYSSAAIERGRLVAAAGDCIVCHTAPGGQPNTGGLALDTPFGTIYTTNITPDRETGIGAWSYAAFERAMRQGVHRDGRQLYPAFPYTAFARLTDGDMQALYAYLMSQPPVAHVPPPTELAFPYNLRPLVAGWNALYHDAGVYQPDPTQTLQWNRGAYLVQGAGHCGACHTPRNALGAERTGAAYLSGGVAEGWEAPALNALSRAPVPWNEQSLYAYLRTGASAEHGVAAGPMAPVIHGLSALPDSDVRAISVYLASLQAPAEAAALPDAAQRIARLEQASAADARMFPENGERLYQGACAACHETRDAPALFGARPSLTLNTNLHSARPDNLVQVILNGIAEPADAALGTMPGFRDSLDDAQVADLVAYLRARHAPDQPAWEDVAATSRRLRATHDGAAAQASNVTSTDAALRRAGP